MYITNLFLFNIYISVIISVLHLFLPLQYLLSMIYSNELLYNRNVYDSFSVISSSGGISSISSGMN